MGFVLRFGFFDSGTAAGNGCSEAKSEVEAFQQQDVFALACLLAEVFADGGEVMDLLSLLQLKRRLLAKRKDLRRRGRRCPAQNSAEISAECGREAFSMKEEDSDCSSCKHSSEREIQQALFQKLKFLASSELNLEVSRCSQVPTVIFQRLVQAVPCKRFLSALLFGVFLRQPEERLTASQFLKALERSVFPPCFFGFLLCLRVLLLHPVYQQPDLRLQLLLRYLPQLVASLLATRVEDSAADAGALRSGEEDQSRTLRLLAAAARRALPEEDSSVVFQVSPWVLFKETVAVPSRPATQATSALRLLLLVFLPSVAADADGDSSLRVVFHEATLRRLDKLCRQPRSPRRSCCFFFVFSLCDVCQRRSCECRSGGCCGLSRFVSTSPTVAGWLAALCRAPFRSLGFLSRGMRGEGKGKWG